MASHRINDSAAGGDDSDAPEARLDEQQGWWAPREDVAMQAEISRAGEYVGVVILTEDGVKIDLEAPDQQEHVETVFRGAGPLTNTPEYGTSGEMRWEGFSDFGDRSWFEKVLGGLASAGYDFQLTKTDTG